ncbi:MAG: hypothetical protein WD826_03255 [Actinomycetota bacterium]
MDQFERQFRNRANLQAIVAGILGIAGALLVSWLIFGHQPIRAGIFETLIVIAFGGLWYHLRRVV